MLVKVVTIEMSVCHTHVMTQCGHSADGEKAPQMASNSQPEADDENGLGR